MFKPKDMSPGFEEGQEVCVHKGLTGYALECGVPAFVLQLWEGKDQEAHVTGYAVIDKDSKQVLFVDRRHDVVEYIIEQFAVQLQKQEQTEEPS
jgi:hypothetical protein